jgi:hypothetical protein
MRQRIAWISGLAGATLVAGGMVACSKPAAPSADLARDLDAAASNSESSLTLAPTSGRRDVISSVEQAPEARRTPTPPRAQLVSHRTTIVPPPAVTIPQAAAVTPPTTTVATVPAAVQPATVQPSPGKRPMQMQPAQTGRYKTEAEVFRNAPFPINP